MPPVLQKTIREIHQRLRALETREYAEVVGPGSVINAQYLTLALHAVLTAERRFVDGDGLVGTDAGANADYTLDIDLVAAWSGLEFVGGELRVDEDAAFTWAGVHTFNVNILLAGGVTIDGMDPSAFLVTYAAHDHSPGDPTQVDHTDLVNVLANQHHAEVHVVNSTGPHAEAGLAAGQVLRASGVAAFAFAQLQHGDLGGVGTNDHHNENHVLLSAPHTDTLAAAVVDGDVIIGNITPRWSRLAIAIPAPNVRNVLGIDNAELRPSWKTALDGVNPVDIGVAAPGISLVFSHRDHVHAHPPGLGANLHHNQQHDVVGGDHTLTGAQWNLVGATALNTIGLLLASSNPGASAAILMSTAAGDLTLHDLTATGQLSAGAGIAEGLILGADAQWYRSAANMLRTPDSVTIDIALNIGTASSAVLAGQIAALNAAVNTTTTFLGFQGSWTKTAGATDADDDFYGFLFDMVMDDVGSTIGYLTGAFIQARLAAGTIGPNEDLRGAVIRAEGVTGTVTRNVYGELVQVVLGAGMTSIGGDVYGSYVYVDAAKDPGGTVYMLYIEEINNIDYCIYQNGSADNYFGGQVGIGTSPSYPLHLLSLAAFDLFVIEQGSNNKKWGLGTPNGQTFFTISEVGIADRLKVLAGGDVVPGGNKTQDLGLNGTAWDDCWADDFQNEPDYYYMDSRRNRIGEIMSVDDLAIIRGIKSSDKWDARTGLLLIDDTSLPQWVFTRDKETGETLYGPDAKPWLSLKMTTSLSWGAIRQLDGHRVEANAEREAIRKQIGILQNQLALLRRVA